MNIMGSQKQVKVKVFDSKVFSKMTDGSSNFESEESTIVLKDGTRHKAKILPTIQSDEKKGNKVPYQLIFAVLGVIGVFISIYLSTLANKLYFTLGVIITIASLFMAFVYYFKSSYTEKNAKNPDISLNPFKGMNADDKRMIGLIVIGLSLASILSIISLALNNASIEMVFSIVGIIELLIIVIVYDRIQMYNKNPTNYPNFNKTYIISHSIILGILVFIAIPIINGVDLIELLTIQLANYNSINLQYNICMMLVSISGIIGILQIRRKLLEESDYDRTIFVRYLIMIIAPIIGLVLFPISANAITESQIYYGALGDFDYFNGIYVALVSSRYSLFSMVMIIMSSLMIIIGKARGQQGSAYMVIGALGMAGVPMIITIMAFIGQVPAPPEFYTLFGEGFAELIFAISYTSVIGLALALVGVFYEIVPSAVMGDLD